MLQGGKNFKLFLALSDRIIKKDGAIRSPCLMEGHYCGADIAVHPAVIHKNIGVARVERTRIPIHTGGGSRYPLVAACIFTTNKRSRYSLLCQKHPAAGAGITPCVHGLGREPGLGFASACPVGFMQPHLHLPLPGATRCSTRPRFQASPLASCALSSSRASAPLAFAATSSAQRARPHLERAIPTGGPHAIVINVHASTTIQHKRGILQVSPTAPGSRSRRGRSLCHPPRRGGLHPPRSARSTRTPPANTRLLLLLFAASCAN